MSYLIKLIAIPMLPLSMNGCAIWKTTAEKAKQEHTRKIELLRLERRKLMLEQSLDRMDSKDPTLEDKKT